MDLDWTVGARFTDATVIPSYCRNRTWQAWRYFTYSFVHADWKHLTFNLLLICVFGGGIEAVHGSTRVAILYFLGVRKAKPLKVLKSTYILPGCV